MCAPLYSMCIPRGGTEKAKSFSINICEKYHDKKRREFRSAFNNAQWSVVYEAGRNEGRTKSTPKDDRSVSRCGLMSHHCIWWRPLFLEPGCAVSQGRGAAVTAQRSAATGASNRSGSQAICRSSALHQGRSHGGNTSQSCWHTQAALFRVWRSGAERGRPAKRGRKVPLFDLLPFADKKEGKQ